MEEVKERRTTQVCSGSLTILLSQSTGHCPRRFRLLPGPFRLQARGACLLGAHDCICPVSDGPSLLRINVQTCERLVHPKDTRWQRGQLIYGKVPVTNRRA